MIIPDSFKDTIADIFYDKTISTYTVSNVVDDEGWARDDESATATGSFKGNIQFDKLSEIQEDYGIDEDITAYITCARTVSVDLGDILGYDGRLYRIIDVRELDSHNLIFVKVWSSKSSISPSV